MKKQHKVDISSEPPKINFLIVALIAGLFITLFDHYSEAKTSSYQAETVQMTATPIAIPTPPTRPIMPTPKSSVYIAPKANLQPTTSPQGTETINGDPVVNCNFGGSCAGTYQMTKSTCLNSVCCVTGDTHKIVLASECSIQNQQQTAPNSTTQTTYQDIQLQIDEMNAKLLEQCRDNARKMYPEYPSGESPEHRNLRMNALNECFTKYGL